MTPSGRSEVMNKSGQKMFKKQDSKRLSNAFKAKVNSDELNASPTDQTNGKTFFGVEPKHNLTNELKRSSKV